MPPASGFKILEKTEYGSYDASLRPNERDYLPKSIKRCRTGSTGDLGRIISVTSPGLGSGITTYSTREMRDDLTDTGKATGSPPSASRGVTTYAETALPHKLTSSGPYNGPATVQWENAGGSTLCSMDFEVTYTPGSYLSYTLGTTLAKSVKTLAYTGVTKSTQAWSKVAGSADVTTSYEYDQRGRVSAVVQPTRRLRPGFFFHFVAGRSAIA